MLVVLIEREKYSVCSGCGTLLLLVLTEWKDVSRECNSAAACSYWKIIHFLIGFHHWVVTVYDNLAFVVGLFRVSLFIDLVHPENLEKGHWHLYVKWA